MVYVWIFFYKSVSILPNIIFYLLISGIRVTSVCFLLYLFNPPGTIVINKIISFSVCALVYRIVISPEKTFNPDAFSLSSLLQTPPPLQRHVFLTTSSSYSNLPCPMKFLIFFTSTAGLMEVIIYSSPDDKKKNRGFCFLEYESHKAASLAKRRLGTGRIKVWGCDIIVDWADPQEEPDEQTMSKVKVLYVRNLTQEITEEKLKESFEKYGRVERVKKIKDYAFIHFEDRENAVKVCSASAVSTANHF